MPAVYNAKLTPLAIDRMADYLLASDDEQAAMRVTVEAVVVPPFFPPYQLASPLRLHDIYASIYAQLLVAAGEDPLLDVFDSRREILRFVWSRSQHHKMVVRVDATKSEILLTAKEIGGWNTEKEPFQLLKTEHRVLTTKQWQSIKDLFARADFWNLGYYDPPHIKDGAGWLTERVVGERYHVAHIWSPETGRYRAACLRLLELSGLPLEPIY